MRVLWMHVLYMRSF